MGGLNSREDIERLGWKHVPEIMCDSVTAWEQEVERGVQAYLQPAEGRGDWFRNPVAKKTPTCSKSKTENF